ncbi:MAG: MotA/TolQ/ExbB proton channel family protein [Betaproteobacteria bacterium]|nr:MotA/TolQ/ExbB proton channel family protein [Betaproteobacteria bacterium]
MSESSWGLSHFLAQTDAVGVAVLIILTVMSLLSWYLIASKLGLYAMLRARSRAFLANFRQVRRTADAEHLRMTTDENNPFARLLGEGFRACQSLQEAENTKARKGARFEITSPDDYVSAALAHSVVQEAGRLERGMTTLASIASTAPFVGLFGTVWAIFHTLQGFAYSAQTSLDKVAGPVGEALIMTAYGLFVSVPALLAYNAFTRQNRSLTRELEQFAHTVFGLLGLGLNVSDAASNEPHVVERLTVTARTDAAKTAVTKAAVTKAAEGAC